MSAPERIWAAPVTDSYGEWQTTTDGLPRPTEYVRADLYASLEAQLDEVKEALTAIDGLDVMEINPSNYDHDDVCELNRNASHASVIARDALSALEATPPAPKVTDAMVEAASCEYMRIFDKHLLSKHARLILIAAQEAGKP